MSSYNVTAGELIQTVQNNNQLIAAGEVETANGAFAVKIPSSFASTRDIYRLPVKVNGDRVVTLGDLARISLTFEDRTGTARFNGQSTVALQVVKRKGFNLIDTVSLVKSEVEAAKAEWPPDLRAAVESGTSNDQSRQVASMVSQLEGSVLTAIALVMIVVLAALGTRPALLVGFAIPTSFLLCFAFLALMGISVSNIVMFGLILAVGMLVDGAIVVVEYADKRISEGVGPMSAYVEAAKRMFWPVVSSTATTLCAFMPMLFWPGVPGEFMGMLPVTLIFVLSASLVVALVYLPVMGGVTGRFSRMLDRATAALRRRLPWVARAALVPVVLLGMFVGAMMVLNPAYLFAPVAPGVAGRIPGIAVFLLFAVCASIVMDAARLRRRRGRIDGRYRRTPFGWFIAAIAGNPVMPLVTIGLVAFFVVGTFGYYGTHNNGVEFFVESEPEQAIVYVRARGNLSLAEKDALVKRAEAVVQAHPGVRSVFAFAGQGGLDNNTGGAQSPKDTIGQVQLETIPWEERADRPELGGKVIMRQIAAELAKIPGIRTEVTELAQGPASGKPVHLRIKGDDWQTLLGATAQVRAKFEATPGLIQVEDTLPLPGIDWQIDVDVEKAGRYGADVATVGAMVQLVTRGILLDTMRVELLGRGNRHPRASARSRPPALDPGHAQGAHQRRPRSAVELRHPPAGGQAGRDQPRRPEALFRCEGGCGRGAGQDRRHPTAGRCVRPRRRHRPRGRPRGRSRAGSGPWPDPRRHCNGGAGRRAAGDTAGRIPSRDRFHRGGRDRRCDRGCLRCADGAQRRDQRQ